MTFPNSEFSADTAIEMGGSGSTGKSPPQNYWTRNDIAASAVALSGGVSVAASPAPGMGVSFSPFEMLTFYHGSLDRLVFDMRGWAP